MGLGHGADTVRTGLVLHVDPKNVKSYNGSFTTLYDVSGNNNHFVYTNDSGAMTYSAGEIVRPNRSVLDFFRSTNQVTLNQGFTMNTLVKVTDCGADASLGGLLSNHNYINNSGSGITIRWISADDYRMSCNTGDGVSRTYSSYYGTSNIKNKWSYLTLRYILATNTLSLWVNANKEFELTYNMLCPTDYLDLHSWSTVYNSTNAYRIAGNVASISVYNTSITDNNIRKNFEGLRARYGI